MFVTFSRAARETSCAALVYEKNRLKAGFGRGRVIYSSGIVAVA